VDELCVWPVPTAVQTPRLTLEPLRVEDAEEMVAVLDDQGLHEFTGGHPKKLEELREIYRRQVAGQSPDGKRGWLNWTVRLNGDGVAVGTVQATLRQADGAMAADLAWTVGSRHQGRGYAKEAAAAMAGWLRSHQVERIAAHIRPDHAASISVARHLGLRPTDELIDGEITWVSGT
jgi:RimJ/RimL family protein N-acetyltransferase